MTKSITFFTLIYKIESKFSFEKYIEWGKNLINNINNHKLYIFTDKNTKELINSLIEGKNNIKIIEKEFTSFYYYRYKLLLKKNTCKDYFPNHNISFKLILLWLERHILFKEIQELVKSDFYCHIDWGYFRLNQKHINWCSNILNKLSDDKLYFALIINDIIYLKNIIKIVEKNEPIKDDINDLLVDNMISIGGGCSVIPNKKIDYWVNSYRKQLNYYMENNYNIKDDQIVLASVIFKKENIRNFELISEINSLPFINYYKEQLNNNYDNYFKKYYLLGQLFQTKNINSKLDIKNIKPKNSGNDNWFPFVKFLNDELENIDFNNNIKDLFKVYQILDTEMDKKPKFENDVYKIYDDTNNKYIYIKIQIDKENMEKLGDLFIYCMLINKSKKLDLEYLSEECDFRIVYN